MSTQPRPPEAASSLSRYHTAYCGVVTDRHGKFERFVRKLDPAHIKNGYWRFKAEIDEKRAHAVGHQSPESILSAVHCGDGTYHDIQLRWVPGTIDGSSVGPLSGNAAQHLQNIHEARRFLGKSMAIPGSVPLYPVEPRMKGYWDAKRAATSMSAANVRNYTTSVPPSPSSHNSRLQSPQVGSATGGPFAQHASFDHGWNTFGSPGAFASSLSTGLGPQSVMVPARSPSRVSSASAHPQSPSPSSTSPNQSRSQHAASSMRSGLGSGTAQDPLIISEPDRHGLTAAALPTDVSQSGMSMNGSQGVSDWMGSGHPSPATAQHSRQSTHAKPSSQSRDATSAPQDLNNDRHHQERDPSGPARPDVMAGHLTSAAAPSSLTYRPRTTPTTSSLPSMPLAESSSILGLPSSLDPSAARPPHISEASGPQLEVLHNTPTQPMEWDDIVCDGPPLLNLDQGPDHDVSHITTSAGFNSDYLVTDASSQEVVNLTGPTEPSSFEKSGIIEAASGKGNSCEQDLAADRNGTDKSTRRENDDKSQTPANAIIQSQPIVEDMYPDLPCMDCGQEAGRHASECYIGNLQVMANLTVLDYRALAEATKRLDPGPWTTHQGPRPDPEQESVDGQIHGMAQIVRNEDSYKNDDFLHALPDDMMVVMWALKTSSNVKVVEEFGDDSGIGQSDSD